MIPGIHFVRQNSTDGIVLGPLKQAGSDDSIVAYAGVTWSGTGCYYAKGSSASGGQITIAASGGGQNVASVASATGLFKFYPGASYFDTVGPVLFAFSNTAFQAFGVRCFVLAPETYDLFFAASGSTLQDELDGLQTSFDETIAPNVVGGASMSGSGFLSDSVSMVRQLTEESSINAKYTDGDILRYLKGSMGTVLTDVNANTDHPVIVRWSFAIEADKQTYTLPAHCQKVYWIAKIDSVTGFKEWEILPGSKWDFGSYGFNLEGNTFRLLGKWKTGYTVELAFVPNAEMWPHKGTTATYTTSTITLDSTPDDGTLDTRPNAYAGYLLRITGSTDSGSVYTQDRQISSYNNQTRVASIPENFSPALAGTVTYEVLPSHSTILQDVVCMHTAMTILGAEGAQKKYALIKDLYDKRMRALRTQLRKEFRVGRVFENQTTTNLRTRNFGAYR